MRHVYVAPDGLLGLLPFEALARPRPEGGWQYLAEEHALVQVGSGRALGRLALTASDEAKRCAPRCSLATPTSTPSPRHSRGWSQGQAVIRRMDVARAQAASKGGTFGARTGEAVRSTEIPRNWYRYQELRDLVDAAFIQLKKLRWSVSPVVSDEWAVEEAVYGLESPRILQFATHGYLMGPRKEGEGWTIPCCDRR